MSKYKPLQTHLEKISAAEWIATFSDVEEIIQGRLPKSAFEYQAWWSNNPEGHSHARSWIEAGWKTESVNVEGRRLIFRRLAKVKPSSVAVWGLLKESVTVPPETDLTEPVNETWTGDRPDVYAP